MMNIFKKGEVKRLDESGLREFYLSSLKGDKIGSMFLAIVLIIMTIATFSFAICYKIDWLLIFSILFIMGVIFLINKFSYSIEQHFENRELGQ